MSDDQGGAQSGAQNQNGNQNQNQQDQNAGKTVSLEDHKRALDDMHKFKKSAADSLEKLGTIQKELESLKNKSKEDSGDFKALYEQTKAQRDELDAKYKNFQSSVINNERLKTLEAELKTRGLKDGNESIVDFADLEKMPHELTTKGRILVHGSKEIADDLQKRYSFAFAEKKPPTVNSGGGSDGNVNVTELTAEYMVELERKDPKKYKEIFPKYLEQRKQRQKAG